MLSYCLLILNDDSADFEFRRANTSQYIVLHGTLHLEFIAGTRDCFHALDWWLSSNTMMIHLIYFVPLLYSIDTRSLLPLVWYSCNAIQNVYIILDLRYIESEICKNCFESFIKRYGVIFDRE